MQIFAGRIYCPGTWTVCMSQLLIGQKDLKKVKSGRQRQHGNKLVITGLLEIIQEVLQRCCGGKEKPLTGLQDVLQFDLLNWSHSQCQKSVVSVTLSDSVNLHQTSLMILIKLKSALSLSGYYYYFFFFFLFSNTLFMITLLY